MAEIKLTNEQLQLISTTLDFYSRMGALDLLQILDHESIDNILIEKHTPKKELEVGVQTMRGEIVEIGDGYIKTKGSWGKGEEIKKWVDVDKIKLSPNWESYHKDKKEIEYMIGNIKNIITNHKIGVNGNYGIYNKEISDSCREAYDIHQVIRHEFWKEHDDKDFMVVSSSVTLTSDKEKVNVKLDTIKEKRQRKINKINKK